MVLSTHSVVGGAAAGVITANPVLGFIVGLVSHFLLDAIPHWDYQLRGKSGEGLETRFSVLGLIKGDGGKLLLDILLGLALILGVAAALGEIELSASLLLSSILWGAAGSVVPDGLQVAYTLWPRSILYHLQRFHLWIHAPIRITNPFVGALLQGCIMVVALSIFAGVLHL